MNEKIALAVVLAFPALTLVMAGEAEPPDGHLRLKRASHQWSAGKTEGQRRVIAAVETSGPVPMEGRTAFGYAWLTDGGNNVLVLTTHHPIDDSSFEARGNGFHTHVLDLKPATAACPGASHEVDLESSKQNRAFDAHYAYQIRGTKLAVQDVPVADLGDPGIESVAAFTLTPVLDRDGSARHLCVAVVDQL